VTRVFEDRFRQIFRLDTLRRAEDDGTLDRQSILD